MSAYFAVLPAIALVIMLFVGLVERNGGIANVVAFNVLLMFRYLSVLASVLMGFFALELFMREANNAVFGSSLVSLITVLSVTLLAQHVWLDEQIRKKFRLSLVIFYLFSLLSITLFIM